MKSIRIALVLALACVLFMQSSALPSSPSRSEPQAELQTDNEVPQQVQHWAAASAEETQPEEVLFRTKRQSHLSLCRYCCNCCKNKGCGFCCKF